jgi:hypothetical protein
MSGNATAPDGALLEPGAPDWGGTHRYDVLGTLGRGENGVVYEAFDRERRQRVALKKLLHVSPAALYLFKQEFRALADLQHTNLVRLYEFVAGGQDDVVFFAMEIVRGTDFLSHVRKPGAAQADFDALRGAMSQLALGVQAVHAAGRLHLDIKPSNVRVTPDGRVVLLDFGMATEATRPQEEALNDEGPRVGTVLYAAPEQYTDEPLTPACDWYSIGAMLYEALVGRPPFVESTFEMITLKNTDDPPAPSTAMPGVPADLDALCCDLLRVNAEMRPQGTEVLRRLGVVLSVPQAPAPRLAERSSGGAAIIGREAHLQALRDAFDATRQGRSITVRIAGGSGMGKSTLVNKFLDELHKREAITFRGRAYERESVPYKAVDGVVDALARHVRRQGECGDPVRLPADVWALARLFPSLRQAPGITSVPDPPINDPQRVRGLAFAALRELIATLAARQPVVLFLDDLQWGDSDSAALLLELVRPPDAPAMLLLTADRDDQPQTDSFFAEMRARWPAEGEVCDLVVGPLEPNDAERLSRSLLSESRASMPRIVKKIARESQGSPFLIEELARSVIADLAVGTPNFDASTRLAITLDAMVQRRLERLPSDARRLLEIVAVGGWPLPVVIAGDAASVYEGLDDAIAQLRAHRLVRTGLRHGREMVETIHDRIRETIVEGLSAETVRAHHRRLAHALEATPDADAEALTVHLLGAGDPARAAQYAERAAEQAVAKLAFDRAARLFRLRQETLPASSPDAHRLRVRLAEVLEWAGRSEDAGRTYLAAAEGVASVEGTTSIERLDLERSASEQLLAAGRIEEGWGVLQRVLANVGIQPPRSPLAAVFWLLVYKLRLMVFGLRFKVRTADEVRPADRARIDALGVVALGLSSIDVLLATCMQARQLVEALRAGDRVQVFRAATIYGNHLSSFGGPVGKHERALNETIASLVGRSASAAATATMRGTRGVGLYMRGRWREAMEHIDGAYANVPVQRAGRQVQASLYAAYALIFLGDLRELRRRHARMLSGAEQRGDLFTTVQLRAAVSAVLALAADDPGTARQLTREALSNWMKNRFVAQNWQVMRSEAEIALYEGDGAAAYGRLEQDTRALKESFLLPRCQYLRAMTAFVRGRAAIASVHTLPERGSARLAEARRLARRLERERMTWTAPLAAILTAGIANAEGDRARERTSLRAAIELAQAADMSLYAAAARHQLGLALGGEEGAEILAKAEDAMRAQEIVAPARFAAMLVPGRWGS